MANRRNGTANLFVLVDAHSPWREVKVTDRRTGADFAHCMRDPADFHYADAKRIRVVMDNLSTHTMVPCMRPPPRRRRTTTNEPNGPPVVLRTARHGAPPPEVVLDIVLPK